MGCNRTGENGIIACCTEKKRKFLASTQFSRFSIIDCFRGLMTPTHSSIRLPRMLLRVAASLVVFVLVGTQAEAQEQSAGSADGSADVWAGVEEMVVSGSTAGGILADVARSNSVTAFDSKDLEAIGAADISDLANFTPNLEIVVAGSTSPTFFIRGIGLNDFNANAAGAVAVYHPHFSSALSLTSKMRQCCAGPRVRVPSAMRLPGRSRSIRKSRPATSARRSVANSAITILEIFRAAFNFRSPTNLSGGGCRFGRHIEKGHSRIAVPERLHVKAVRFGRRSIRSRSPTAGNSFFRIARPMSMRISPNT